MTETNDPGGSNHRDDEELIAIYEQLRAAERNGSTNYLYADCTMKVNIDWAALERRVLQPALPDRIRNFCFAIAPRAVAMSIIGPVVGLIATFYWLRGVPVSMSQDFLLRVVMAAAALVLMFIWAALAMQAMNRARHAAYRDVPQPVFASGGMMVGYLVVTFLISTSVMAMATYSFPGAPQRRWLHSIDHLVPRPEYALTALSTGGDQADRWTRLAELQIRKANLQGAQQMLRKVKTLDDVPAYERARADVLCGYIDARVTWQELLTASRPSPRIEGIARLDEAIDNVNGASQTLGSDARVLLSYLYLARAAATEDPAERAKWREAALRFSLHALDAARAIPAKDIR
ncbi:MAG TPA: hypothetical protein VEK57_04535 [Thermoanaerobaculia bacterium]|nr:hypothetical protein [Thermoanaerobaculia bacterium]